MRFPVSIKFDPRLSWWKDGSVIVLAIMICRDGDFGRFTGRWLIDLTVLNFGVKIYFGFKKNRQFGIQV